MSRADSDMLPFIDHRSCEAEARLALGVSWFLALDRPATPPERGMLNVRFQSYLSCNGDLPMRRMISISYPVLNVT